MKQIAYSFPYTSAVLLTAIVLASPSHTVAQATSTQAPAETQQGPGSTTVAKASTGNPVEARIKDLHTKLKITPAQEDLWKNVTQVMRDNERAMEALHKTRSEKAETMTAVDDVKSYTEIAANHAEGLKKFVPVFEALYNSMSDEQKKNTDTVFSSRNPMGKKHKASPSE